VLQSKPDVDLWGLEEVVGTSQFASMVTSLPGFASIVATDIPGGGAYYAAAEQKVGILYRQSKLSVISKQLILTASQYDFAYRPPLEIKLHATGSGVTQDFYVIVLHMKADADQTSYDRRVAAGVDLKTYLDSTRANDAVMVIGDWNDDVDTSIFASNPSPYANLVTDSAHYRFATKELSDTNQHTTVSFASTIDHQLLNAALMPFYQTGSATVTHPSITAYSSTTTDHYPVTTHYVFP